MYARAQMPNPINLKLPQGWHYRTAHREQDNIHNESDCKYNTASAQETDGEAVSFSDYF